MNSDPNTSDRLFRFYETFRPFKYDVQSGLLMILPGSPTRGAREAGNGFDDFIKDNITGKAFDLKHNEIFGGISVNLNGDPIRLPNGLPLNSARMRISTLKEDHGLTDEDKDPKVLERETGLNSTFYFFLGKDHQRFPIFRIISTKGGQDSLRSDRYSVNGDYYNKEVAALLDFSSPVLKEGHKGLAKAEKMNFTSTIVSREDDMFGTKSGLWYLTDYRNYSNVWFSFFLPYDADVVKVTDDLGEMRVA